MVITWDFWIVSRKSWNYIAKNKDVHREVKSEGR